MIQSPISFSDETGVRWTVVVRPAPRPGQPGNELLTFTSAAGERRTCDGCLPDGGTWEDVDERAWRALLHYSEALPDA